MVPDIILPDPLDFNSDIESESTLDNPLRLDPIPAAQYEKFNLVQPYVADLSRESATRVATNQDFNYIRQDIEEIKKLDADKTITLNESQAIKDRRVNLARQTAREKEHAARPPKNITVYNLSLDDAGKSGLPAPVYYPGILETNTVSTTTNQSLSVVRYDLIKGGTTNTFFATNSPSGGSGTGSFSVDTITVKNQPDLDPLLEETDNIMVDYISLLMQHGVVTKN